MSRTTIGITFREHPPVDLSKRSEGNAAVLATVEGVDADQALDSALDLLDAVRGGLLAILDEPAVSCQVSLLLHANETALALVRAALEGGEVANG
ncbi:hypothetical protein [Pseudomonas sp. NBRC 100443]|uniref:hypothetical protein n=1 Tax=Pseudomonas sp. NBRC 100443 TaxID=1113665 RepID=UPI00249FB369|nr:hypothetical protein [Pseudomonas sp. NBRC 100443]GLU37151.1 hypothetical protein Pssp01_12440 [Pseudomonas sp. NBRC 100443]